MVQHLVLQVTLAALVAYGAVQRVVDLPQGAFQLSARLFVCKK